MRRPGPPGTAAPGRQRERGPDRGRGAASALDGRPRTVRRRARAERVRADPRVLHFVAVSRTITIRLTRDLAEWLAQVAERTGVPQGQIVREALERARAGAARGGFMRLAGSVRGPKDLSARKGFSRP